MKKLISLVAVMSLALTVFAQPVTKNFAVANYTGISAGSVFDIELTKGNVESLKIEAENDVMPYIQAKVNSGILYLKLDNSMPSKLSRNMDPIKVKISIKELDKLFLSGAAKLKSSGTFSPASFKADISGAVLAEGLYVNTGLSEITVSGASKFDLTGKATTANYELSGASVANIAQDIQDLNISASGAVKMEFSGKTAKAEISISGAANARFIGSSVTAIVEVSGASQLEAEKFPVADMSLEVSGVGNVKVNVSKSISAEVSGGSTVRYMGNPVIKNLETNTGSSFKKMD
jgi:hypothetical protein